MLTDFSYSMRSVMLRPWRVYLQRLARFIKPCKTLLLYPYTWVVLALILVTHLSFAWWFQPAPAMQRLASQKDIRVNERCSAAMARMTWAPRRRASAAVSLNESPLAALYSYCFSP